MNVVHVSPADQNDGAVTETNPPGEDEVRSSEDAEEDANVGDDKPNDEPATRH